VGGLLGSAAAPAKADPAVGVAVVAPITPLTLGAGTAATVVAHELFQPRPFGHNGEGVKLLRKVFPHL
jgi:hypothetical protein